MAPQNRAAWLKEKQAPQCVIDNAPFPEPGPEELVVQVKAVAFNPVDAAVQSMGIIKEVYPAILGHDAAGIVYSVGTGEISKAFKPGDHVIGLGQPFPTGDYRDAAYQDYIVMKLSMIAKVPDLVEFKDAVVLPLAFGTAASSLFDTTLLALEKPMSGKRKEKTLLIWNLASIAMTTRHHDRWNQDGDELRQPPPSSRLPQNQTIHSFAETTPEENYYSRSTPYFAHPYGAQQDVAYSASLGMKTFDRRPMSPAYSTERDNESRARRKPIFPATATPAYHVHHHPQDMQDNLRITTMPIGLRESGAGIELDPQNQPQESPYATASLLSTDQNISTLALPYDSQQAIYQPQVNPGVPVGANGQTNSNPTRSLTREELSCHMEWQDVWLNLIVQRFITSSEVYSFTDPKRYKLPESCYHLSLPQTPSLRHRDVLRRITFTIEQDTFLNPEDGKLSSLIVQTTTNLYNSSNNTSWKRTGIENVSSLLLRLAYWPFACIPEPTQTVEEQVGLLKATRDRAKTIRQINMPYLQFSLRWGTACLGILLAMCKFDMVEGSETNGGSYDHFPYRLWTYPKSARNLMENPTSQNNLRLVGNVDNRLIVRDVRPRKLCFLNAIHTHPRGVMAPETWMHGNGAKQPTYIFVSFTSQNQFARQCKRVRDLLERSPAANVVCDCDECKAHDGDMEALHKIAYHAAQRAGVKAYWLDDACVSRHPLERRNDVYSISDVVRGAKLLAVVVGRSGRDTLDVKDPTDVLLKEWGQRLWTWPEVILGPAHKEIEVYTRGGDWNQPAKYSKLEFPARVWDDGDVARQLVDNFDSTLTLSRLELVVLALKCLTNRLGTGSSQYLRGDLAYVLMGLMRQRPVVDPTDSAFQAFARLSLANDSDRLLERMICLLPLDNGNEKGDHYWTNLNDYWQCELWDIEPTCQIAGIAEQDTVIIDGTRGALIHWDRFRRVQHLHLETWTRTMSRWLTRSTPVLLLTAMIMVSVGGKVPPVKALGIIILLVSLCMILMLPWLVLHIYGGKVWGAQPWFMGFEGYMSMRDIEYHIFGFPNHRLRWSPCGSSLSRHQRNESFSGNECKSIAPSDQITTPGKRLFTLVDTGTMTVTVFEAERPPVMAMICGSEGGMQRAIMCSYDFTTQTLFRETVLRMETPVTGAMDRLGRVKFGLRREKRTQDAKMADMDLQEAEV